MKGRQQSFFYAFGQITPVHQIVLTKRQQVTAISSFRRGGQSKQKFRFKIVDELAIGAGGGVMKFVDDDVIKLIWCKLSQMVFATDGLDRTKDHIRVRLFFLAGIKA